ncbi:PTS sugar transporter subunit IIBC [Paeniclostridium hominis]|uniref:PTS sugar transporter subunit IIBC n=1 Tax=Paeniclostridium hominis TaxID=2764329 RepID=UPI0022E26E2B|nr:PTS sugar transporter subunit IIBC [Paeniclostridium hominis]
MNNIVVICENTECANKLGEESNKLGYNVKFEIQKGNDIIDKISIEDIKSAKAVLFTLNRSIEDIQEIERFIDVEYYEVEPSISINNPDQVIKDIIADLNN